MAFPDLTIVIPHGGAARIRNLRAVVARLVEAEAEHVLIMEMDREPRVRELARAAGFRHVFVEQETTFHKTRAMNAAIPLLRTERLLWLDSDILLTGAVIAGALDEMNSRSLDCLVPWTTVRYLSEEDSAEVAAGRRDPAECAAPFTLYSRKYGCGGAIFARTEFVRQIGGMREEFHGWGREDGAFFAMARTLGRSSVTMREDVHLHHLDHPVDAPRRASPKHDWMVWEIRSLRDPAQLQRRYPRPAHFTPPWRGTKRIACAAGAEDVGRVLAELYGPAVSLCAIDDGPDIVAHCDPPRTSHDAAIEVASRITTSHLP